MKLAGKILIYSGLSLGLITVPVDKLFKLSSTVSPAIAQSMPDIGQVDVSYEVTDVYDGAYRVELTIVGNSASDSAWQGSIHLPENHTILENYGVLISEGSNRVNFAGDSWNQRLLPGHSTVAVLIVEGDPQLADQISFQPSSAELGNPVYSSINETERQLFDSPSTTASNPTFRHRERLPTADLALEPDQELESNFETLPTEEFDDSSLIDQASPIIEEREISSGMEIVPSLEESQSESPTSSDLALESNLEAEKQTVEKQEREIELPTIDNYQNLGTSPGTGSFNYADALELNWLFFMANRSGSMGNDNVLDWRSDSTLNDGQDVGRDLSGGYFDAGDHIKFTLPMAFSMTILAWSGVDYQQSYNNVEQLQELQNAVRQGTDYFLKSHEMSGGNTQKLWVQVGDKEDHYHWVPPEEIDQVTARPSFAIDPSNPGTDAAAGTAAALASASMLFANTDAGYSTELLTNAIALFDFAETYKGKYSDSVSAANPFYTSWSGYEDELVLGAIWLYRATGDSSYLSKAEDYFKQGIRHIGSYGYVTDDASYGALALLAKESSDPFFRDEFKSWAENWIKGQGGVKHTSDGFAVRAEWASVPIALGASYLLEWYSDFVEPNQGYSQFAQQQVDYVLGQNSRGLSYLIGFGDNYPIRPHHRGSAGSQPLDGGNTPNDNILYGAIVGGPRNDDFSHEDKRNDWVTNEVGTSYNAPFAAAAIQQVDNAAQSSISQQK